MQLLGPLLALGVLALIAAALLSLVAFGGRKPAHGRNGATVVVLGCAAVALLGIVAIAVWILPYWPPPTILF